jgi:hypothetical protein
MKTTGTLILITLICAVIFMAFIAIRPAPAQSSGSGMELLSVRKTAAKFKINPTTVQRVSRPFEQSVVGL